MNQKKEPVEKDLVSKPKSGKFVLVLSATIDDIDKPLAEAIVAHLRQISEDATLTLTKIESGSIRLFLEGSEDRFQILKNLIDSGVLTQILGIPIQDIYQQEEIHLSDSVPEDRSRINVTESISEDTKSSYELQLIQQIRTSTQALSIRENYVEVIDSKRVWDSFFRLLLTPSNIEGQAIYLFIKRNLNPIEGSFPAACSVSEFSKRSGCPYPAACSGVVDPVPS